MSTYPLRKKLLDIVRRDVGLTEESKNQARWISKLWEATNYPDGMHNREPYCAAGVAYGLREWLKDEEVLKAFGLTASSAEKWRCQEAAVKNWMKWARQKSLRILPPKCILKAGDLIIYKFEHGMHIEICSDDDNTTYGPFVAVGYNTNASGSRDGEGCFEKPRLRRNVLEVIRLLEDK